MAEKDFTRELMRGLKTLNGFAHKIEDVPVSRLVGVAQGTKGTGAKPFDVFWQGDNQFHAIENKQEPWALDVRAERNEAGKDTPGLKKHQEEALLAVRAGGGFAWVVCHFHGKMTKREQLRWGREFLDRAIAVPIHRIVDARVIEGARSLDFDWFLANGLELELTGRTVSDRAWVPWILGSEAGKAIQS